MAIAATPERCGQHADVQNLAPPRTAEAGPTEAAAPGRLRLLIDADHRRHEAAHSDRERHAARRHLRSLCEDLDELLGQLGEAARHHHGEAADPLLIDAVAIAAELARRLPCGEHQQNAAAAHVAVDVLDEADVLRTLALLDELDAELAPTAHGDGAARASALAGAMLARIDALARAAASGRTRSRELLPPPSDHANTVTAGHRPQKVALTELLRPSGRAAAGNRTVPGFELDADASLAPDAWRWRVRPRRLDGSLGPPVAVGLTLAEAERIRRRCVDGLAARLSWAERAVHVPAAQLRS